MDSTKIIPELLKKIRQAVRVRHYSYRTEQAYVYWIEKFLHYFHYKHPAEMGSSEISRTSTIWLAVSIWPPLPRTRPLAPCSSSIARCWELS